MKRSMSYDSLRAPEPGTSCEALAGSPGNAGVQALPELFGAGPILWLARWLSRSIPSGRLLPGPPTLWRYGAAVALLSWVPLLVLAAVASAYTHGGDLGSLGTDYALHCRSLVAAPVLILAEALCPPQLQRLAQHFVSAGLIAEPARDRFERVISSTRRLAHSPTAHLSAFGLTYALVLCVLVARPERIAWQHGGADPLAWLPGGLSPAGLWHLLVSVPLLLALCLGWFWRLFVWVRFLWLVSRLELVLSPAHPDQSAGLRFLAYSLRDFSALGFAFGTLVAGNLANRVVRHEVTMSDYQLGFLGLVAFIVVLFGGPLLLFTGQLQRAWRSGVHQYGRLAGDVGRQLESRWLHEARVDEQALGVQDFSAVTDLYQVVGNVYGMRLLLIDARSVAILILSTLLPLLAVALSSLPRDVLRSIVKLVL
jgi:hypothetical protein